MRPQIFGQDSDILASRAGTTAGQYGRDAAHISWTACVQTSLEDCMGGETTSHERELFSQTWKKSEVGDSADPNSKSLGAYF